MTDPDTRTDEEVLDDLIRDDGPPVRSWSAHPHFERLVPAAEPWTPPARRPRPATGWPKTGTLGAYQTMDVDTEPPAERPPLAVHHVAAQLAVSIGQLEWPSGPPATEDQAAAFQAVEDAAREHLAAHAQAYHRNIEAAMLGISPAPRRGWFARAIGWFRR
ncbi:hypothetical protein [Amycolatopsis eburnea]|uniref:Uncharacterized protein n=1 Tax=Amycolatopsis eburnea TaxID=2267691 RepID=A0A3R9FA13_9PSEU|nr:hypothetical protein [Amycolatopsis eburnea]RSD21985.1 hypothetical protein EIY87_09210 [Amycolatopsis eburnea]